jgi:hypothetical protein
MDKELISQINELTKQGWKLCMGCGNYFKESYSCKCTIDTRKFYGIPPKSEVK